MSVVGFDLGNLSSVIAVARNRGIDIITNEVSNRATPTLVAFGEKGRIIGEGAKTQEVRNLKNTVSNLTRLLALPLGQGMEEEEAYETQYLSCRVGRKGKETVVTVRHAGEEKEYTTTQIIAMYLGRLKATTEADMNGATVSDVVISVPDFWVEEERRACLDAAKIAGLNVLRLINATTASALAYGITKTDLPVDDPRYVCLVDVGHASYKVAVVSYVKGSLEVRGRSWDRCFGGRDLDQLLVKHFAAEFKAKTKLDLFDYPKGVFRFRAAAEKMKKVLSANPEASFNVESVVEDRDFRSSLTRDAFEELCDGVLGRLEAPIEAALAQAGVTKDQIDAIEMVGGSTRIPYIKRRLGEIFGKDVSSTLNQDEAIARGAALQCAMISPVFKVRDFSIQDISAYPIKLQWPATEEDPTDTGVQAFRAGEVFPITKQLTFYRKDAFSIDAAYGDLKSGETTTAPGQSTWIGKYDVKKVTPNATGGLSGVKVKVRMNIHGVVTVEQAQQVEEIVTETKEEESTEDTAATDANDVPATPEAATEEKKENDKPNDNATATPATATAKPLKKKKTFRKTDLPVEKASPSLAEAPLLAFREAELAMTAADKLVADTEETKNALEEYVYDIRDKVSSAYRAYIEDKECEVFMTNLTAMEDWLYDEGEDETKSCYAEKLKGLRAVGDPVIFRARESEERGKASKAVTAAVTALVTQADSTDEKLAHITEEERARVRTECETVNDWLTDQKMAQAALAKYQPPCLTSAAMYAKRDALIATCTPILSRPAPKPEPPVEEAKPEESNGEEKPAADATADVDMDTTAPAKEEMNMDVD